MYSLLSFQYQLTQSRYFDASGDLRMEVVYWPNGRKRWNHPIKRHALWTMELL